MRAGTNQPCSIRPSAVLKVTRSAEEADLGRRRHLAEREVHQPALTHPHHHQQVPREGDRNASRRATAASDRQPPRVARIAPRVHLDRTCYLRRRRWRKMVEIRTLREALRRRVQDSPGGRQPRAGIQGGRWNTALRCAGARGTACRRRRQYLRRLRDVLGAADSRARAEGLAEGVAAGARTAPASARRLSSKRGSPSASRS